MDYNASNLTDDELRRLTDGEVFHQTAVDLIACRCGMRFCSVDHMIDLLTSLAEACINDGKQEAYYGLRDLMRVWRDRNASIDS